MELINSFLPAIEAFGIWGYWLVLVISVAEAMPFIGLILPGGVVVGFFGFLSAQGYLNIINLIWFAAAGAILGDGIGYYLGTKGMAFFRIENKIFKLSHLKKGEEYFRKHGSKSILFGRFVGVLRPIVPFVAGLSGMDKRVFLFWNVIGGVLWSITYLLTGYFFGSALPAIEAWSTKGGIILLSLLVSIIGIRIILRRKRK
ncbi:MAG: DedA family protein [Candidatus Liptonbacteria bacterium]|nr:DedA family protein [Candidatus Liptonbacteria bacterium]